MCLEINIPQSSRLWLKLLFCRKIKCYKRVCYDYHNNIYSPYYQELLWKPGWNVSDRESRKLNNMENTTSSVFHGIHVYLDKTGWLSDASLIIEMWAYAKDFVAAGNGNEAVFTKVWLDPKEYEKAMKKIEKIETAII